VQYFTFRCLSLSKKPEIFYVPDCFLQTYLTHAVGNCVFASINWSSEEWVAWGLPYVWCQIPTPDCAQWLGSCHNFSLESGISSARTEECRLYPNEDIFALQNSALYDSYLPWGKVEDQIAHLCRWCLYTHHQPYFQVWKRIDDHNFIYGFNDDDDGNHKLIPLCVASGRLCVLVVRAPGYKSRDPGFYSRRVPDLLRSSVSGTGSTQPREDN
jgi:hypothetical protein